jgi:EF-P beta-lysylation protein EpmB
MKRRTGLDNSVQILTTTGDIVPTGYAHPSTESDDDSRMPEPHLSSTPAAASEPADWQASMRAAIRSGRELRLRLGLPQPDQASEEAESHFRVFVTEEFLSRIQPGNVNDPLLRQVLPIADESQHVDGFVSDPVGDAAAALAPNLLQKYHRRALLISTGVCGIHCRYCFRRDFDYVTAGKPSAGDSNNWDAAIAILEADAEIDEVILSGGDPLTLTDAKLSRLIDALERIPNINRLRIHSRMPIVIPQRVAPALLRRLRASRLAVWMVVHCNHVNEIDEAVASAFERLVFSGIPVLNQAVMLRGVNDSADALEALCRRLVDLRVQPYYLHQLDRVRGAAHFETEIQRGREIVEELRTRLPGYAVPQFVAEYAGQRSKTPLV